MLRSLFVGTALAASAILVAPLVSGGAALPGARPAAEGASVAAVLDGRAASTTEPVVEMLQRATWSSVDDDAGTAEVAPAAAPAVESGTATAGASSSTSTSTSAAPQPAPTPSSNSNGSTAAASGGTTTVQPQPSGPAPAPAPAAPAPAPTVTTPACAGMPGGGTAGAPGRTSAGGVAGTTSADLAQFAQRYNEIRVANCLPPVPFANIRYDSCMEDRLFWMAEDPSTDPMSAWGHIGSQRSDGVPSVGCDGNLAGGSNNSGTTVAQKWWDSSGHRTSLYKPTYTGSTAGVCVLFAMTHGGVPNEPYSFTRAASRWVTC